MRRLTSASDGSAATAASNAASASASRSERGERLSAADERRHVLLVGLERPVEERQRGLRLLARELHVAEAGRGGIEARRRLQRRGELALGVLQVAGLEEPPAAILARRRPALPASAAGTRGRDELGELRRDRRVGAGTSFGAQATAAASRPASATRVSLRIPKILPRGRLQAAQEPPRHVGDDRDPAVARLVPEDVRVPVEARDPLAVAPRRPDRRRA